MKLDQTCARGDATFQSLLNEKLDNVRINYQPQGQLCGEETCPSKVEDSIVQVGNASVGNSTANWPSNSIFTLPYLFPTGEHSGTMMPYRSQSHVWTHPKTWEMYWVPFAKQYGVLPLMISTPPRTRQVFVGTNTTDSRGVIRTPEDAKGMKMRRTQSRVSARSIEKWGMNAQAISWSDTLQGLKTGVVDAYTAYDNEIWCFGQAEATGSITFNHWTIGDGVFWTNVEWLKSLTDEQRTAVAEASKEAFTKSVRAIPRIEYEQVGVPKEPGADPAEGSKMAEKDVKPVVLNEDELDAWKEPVRADKNKNMWSDILEDVDNIGVDSDALFDHLWNTARGNDVPKLEEYEPRTWWDEYIDQI